MENVILVGLKCVLEKIGVQYVTTFGRIKMQVLLVNSLVSRNMVYKPFLIYSYLYVLKYYTLII